MKSTKNITLLTLCMIINTLLVIMCYKGPESAVPPTDNNGNFRVKERDDPEFTTMTINMTAENGQCYRVTLDRQPDNSIVFSKVPIACDNTCTNGSVFATTAKQPQDGKLWISDNQQYWFIPLNGGGAVARTGGYYECFCEGQPIGDDETCSSPGGTDCYFIPGHGYTCYTYCCSDCDLQYCEPGMPPTVDETGVVVMANYIIFN